MICCCCGFNEQHGIYISDDSYIEAKRKFVCERCFMHPDLFFPAKRIFPHWVTTKKLSRKVMKLCRDLTQMRF